MRTKIVFFIKQHPAVICLVDGSFRVFGPFNAGDIATLPEECLSQLLPGTYRTEGEE